MPLRAPPLTVVLHRQPTAFTCGKEQTVIAVALGMPGGEEFAESHLQLADELEKTRRRMSFPAQDCCHRRGDFFVKAHGTSFGGGQEVRRSLTRIPQWLTVV